jgi:prephenate dehydratase
VGEDEVAGAVLPIENSLAGTVGEALDALLRARLSVRAELLLPVRHRLLVVPGATLDTIERVTSQQQALAQCEAFLARRPWRLIVADDTAAAARRLAESGDRALAVVASERAGRRYGLVTLASDIQGGPNFTRFAVIARSQNAPLPAATGPLAPPSTARQVSLVVFETHHTAGALHHALGAFAEAGVSLNRIESRPTLARRWEYRFIVGVDGHRAADPLRGALTELRRRAHAVRVLGSFPSAGSS